MTFARNKAALTANTSYVVGTTPTGYAPLSAVTQMIPIGRNGDVAYFSVSSNGEISIRTYANVAADEYAYNRVTYLCN